VTRLGLEPRTC